MNDESIARLKKYNLSDWDIALLEKVRGRKIYADVTSVSRSGMSRHIKYACIIDDELRNITYLIARLTGCRYDRRKNEGLFVRGCGMDMIFAVLSDFNYVMAKIDTGKDVMELLKTKECGDRIYDKYFRDANNYGSI